MNIGLASLYCLYVLASGVAFSLSILSILLGIGWIACFISNVPFNEYFGKVVLESKEKLIDWFNGLHF